MAALASLGSLFENPPSWKEIMAEESGITEIFGELHFQEKQDTPPEFSSDRYSESLQLCTEGLGFESSDTVEIYGDVSGRGREAAHRRSASEGCSMYCGRRQERPNVDFPPPISCIGGGKPGVRFRSFRRDGRFVLKEFRLPCQEFLRAFRKDGRLTLHFVHPAAARSESEASADNAEKIEEGDDSAMDKID